MSAPSTHPNVRIQYVQGETQRAPAFFFSDSHRPILTATRWFLEVRQHQVALNTMRAEAPIVARLFANSHIGDLDQRLLRGPLPNSAELIRCVRAVPIRPRVKGRDTERVISSATAHLEQTTAARFILDAISRPLPQSVLTSQHESIEATAIRLKNYIATLSTSRVGRRQSTSDSRIDPLTEEEVEALWSVLAGTGNSHRPFGPAITRRTAVMVGLGLQLGLRIGEMLKLKVQDFSWGRRPRLAVLRREGDPDDPRRHPPAVKTQERVLPLPRQLAELINGYLTGPRTFRRSVNLRMPTPFLLTSQSGTPLTQSAAQDVIRRLRAPTGVCDLRWHSLRHTWAEAMYVRLDGDHDRLHTLKLLGGWASDQAARHYTQKAAGEKASQVEKSRLEELYRDDEANVKQSSSQPD